MKQIKKLSCLMMACLIIFCFEIQASAQETDEVELESDEQWEYVENDPADQNIALDAYVDGIYNDSNVANARSASLTGVIRLASSSQKLYASYTTTYPYVATKVGVKNIRLQYQNSLKVWTNAIKIDDRHVNNDSFYTGYFTCNGVFNRTYRLKVTHYVVYNGKTQTKTNVTENLKF